MELKLVYVLFIKVPRKNKNITFQSIKKKKKKEVGLILI